MSSNNNANLESRILISSIIQTLVENKNYDYVMGAGSTGMLYTAQELLSENGAAAEIIGLKDSRDLEKSIASYKVETENVFERTQRIYEDSDVLLFLPGGIGTIAELYAMLDANIENEKAKPIFIYNADHSYDLLLEDMKTKIKDGFISPQVLINCHEITTEEQLVEQLSTYEEKESKVKK